MDCSRAVSVSAVESEPRLNLFLISETMDELVLASLAGGAVGTPETARAAEVAAANGEEEDECLEDATN